MSRSLLYWEFEGPMDENRRIVEALAGDMGLRHRILEEDETGTVLCVSAPDSDLPMFLERLREVDSLPDLDVICENEVQHGFLYDVCGLEALLVLGTDLLPWEDGPEPNRDAGEVVVEDGDVACSLCGGSVECSGLLNFGFVSVYSIDGCVYHDWSDSGSGEFEIEEYHCGGCGAVLTIDIDAVEADLRIGDERAK